MKLAGWTCLAVCSIPLVLLGSEPSKEPWRVLPKGERPQDARLKEPRTLRDTFHPWQPTETKAEWEQQAQSIRERVLVATGLWPLPPKTPLNPVIHGKIDRGEYTVEKVYFASHPGHYVTGNLYRPKKIEGKVPGVLTPHGHWANGRFYDAGDKAAAQLEQGAEQFDSGARFPLQARMVQLARMGCVVFHYDMVGYADSQSIAHRTGFNDVEAGLWLQNKMGLQTWNSIRALDFLLSLPEVDSDRIGVTGASGGGTQTFMLCAIDSRPTVAFPAVMVSTNMQGGCVCENADYLRIGINNIAVTALFAPKPLAMSGANDWTIDIETKGLPELKQVYGLYGKEDLVHAKCFPQFGHNYNQLSREMMYTWFNQHLKLGLDEPIRERDFEPIPLEELSMFDDEHPLPEDAKSAEQLREYLTTVAERQFAELLPEDKQSAQEYQRIVGTAAKVMLDDGAPTGEDAIGFSKWPAEPVVLADGKTKVLRAGLTRGTAKEMIPVITLSRAGNQKSVVLWIDSRGKQALFNDRGLPIPAVSKLLDAGFGVVAADVLMTGEFLANGTSEDPQVDKTYHGYTFGYNRPLLSNRVRDVLTVIGLIRNDPKNMKTLHLVGTGEAGLWVMLARALAGEHVDRTIVELNRFSFTKIKSPTALNFLPGALKYGGVGGLAALAAPGNLTVAGMKGVVDAERQPLEKVYAAADGKLTLLDGGLRPDEIVGRLLAE